VSSGEPQQIQRAIRNAERLQSEKKYRRAIIIVRRILEFEPNHERALQMKNEIEDLLERSHNMMIVARRMVNEGQNSEAETIVGKVLEMDPYNPDALEWKRKSE
jgi:hypothetical protein